MEIVVGGDTAQVESLDVSANGVYFQTPIYISVLTKLRITLDLSGDDESSRSRSVACDGVVVRTQPEFEDKDVDEYNVACFFTSISDADQETLEQYILGRMPF